MVRGDLLETWVDRYGKELHAYLWRMLANPQDAEDCLQETFLRALRHRGPFPIREPRAWLYAVAGNVARSHLRRRRREWDGRVDVDDDHLAGSDGQAGKDQWDAVRRAVDSLPAKQRQAILLRRYQGLSYAEVARALGGSAEAARANVHQAVLKLRKAFPEETR